MSRSSLICGASLPLRSLMALLISATNRLISSSVVPFSSSMAPLALDTSSSVSCASANPATPARRSSSSTAPITPCCCRSSSASVRASTAASMLSSSSSRFSRLYLASLAFTASNFAFQSSPLSTLALLSSVRVALLSYSLTSCVLRAAILSRFKNMASRLPATLFATCACCRSCASPSRLPMSCWRRSSSSRTRAFSWLTMWVCSVRSPSVCMGDRSTLRTDIRRPLRFSSSAGIRSVTNTRWALASSPSCASNAVLEPVEMDARISRSRTAVRWYFRSACSLRSYWSCSCCCRSISASCSLRSLVARSLRSASAALSSTLDATLPLVTLMREVTCSFSCSSSLMRSLSFTGSLRALRVLSSSLWFSANCRCSSCTCSCSSCTSGSMQISPGTATSFMKYPTKA
mmetsp:Transcript_20313/g.50746  ORF Transcript_20313/g.50746 Transcript_20313/m.50746 type:complete len:405 (+) Transcript_20313:402-1616(+)